MVSGLKTCESGTGKERENQEPAMRKNTAKKIMFLTKGRQSPCPVKNALQNLAGNILGKPVPLCQPISVKPTGKTPNLSASGDSARDKTAYHYYQLLPYLRLQELVVDLEVTVLLMNHVAVNQYYRISLLPYASK